MRHASTLSIGLFGTVSTLAATSAYAENDCVFLEQRKTLFLQGDCETDTTLTIPDGFTLDGRGHRVTVHDPAAEDFSGAVVRNTGSTAHVHDLVIDADGLRAECHPSTPVDRRLRAILFQDASGTIINNRITAIDQGASGCQEGVAIEVRTAPDSGVERTATVLGNRIYDFQKTGILVLGNIDANISLNRVTGQGPLDFIAQNGIQISDGAHGDVRWNHVSDVVYTGPGAAGAGILVLRTTQPIDIVLNQVESADVGLWLASASRVTVEGNVIASSTYDGIAMEGQSGATQHNRVLTNHVTDSGNVGIDLYGTGTTQNFVGANQVCDSGEAATQEALGAANNLTTRVVCVDFLGLAR